MLIIIRNEVRALAHTQRVGRYTHAVIGKSARGTDDAVVRRCASASLACRGAYCAFSAVGKAAIGANLVRRRRGW